MGFQRRPATHLLGKTVPASPDQHHPAAHVDVVVPQQREVTFPTIMAVQDSALEHGKSEPSQAWSQV